MNDGVTIQNFNPLTCLKLQHLDLQSLIFSLPLSWTDNNFFGHIFQEHDQKYSS